MVVTFACHSTPGSDRTDKTGDATPIEPGASDSIAYCALPRDGERSDDICGFLGSWTRTAPGGERIEMQLLPNGTYVTNLDGGDYEDEWAGRWEDANGAAILFTEDGCQCERLFKSIGHPPSRMTGYSEPAGVPTETAWERTDNEDPDCDSRPESVPHCAIEPGHFELSRMEISSSESEIRFERDSTIPGVDAWHIARHLETSFKTFKFLRGGGEVIFTLQKLVPDAPGVPSSALRPGEYLVQRRGDASIELTFAHDVPILAGDQLEYEFFDSPYSIASGVQRREVPKDDEEDRR
ncbi:MAG: hypothetical protein B7733_15370 [Myxococcales bacterium FL481]|nr:MAG: hypothetical protein B7733_15370 [Myxococcales bacterium FL481]